MATYRVVLAVCVALGVVTGSTVSGGAGPVDLVVLDKPLHAGRISPMLYSGFVELLDDVVPGMWAEMLGDRDFEGVLPAANWAYHLGTLNLCDRDWDRNETWEYSTEEPWCGAQSAKLTAGRSTSPTGGIVVRGSRRCRCHSRAMWSPFRRCPSRPWTSGDSRWDALAI